MFLARMRKGKMDEAVDSVTMLQARIEGTSRSTSTALRSNMRIWLEAEAEAGAAVEADIWLL